MNQVLQYIKLQVLNLNSARNLAPDYKSGPQRIKLLDAVLLLWGESLLGCKSNITVNTYIIIMIYVHFDIVTF